MPEHPLRSRLPELHTTDDVQRAVLRADRQRPPDTRKLANEPTPRLDAFVSRLERIFLNLDPVKRARNIETLRPLIHNALVITRENVPEEYFELQRRVAREQGHGEITITHEMRERMINTVIEDQTKSLDAWIDYLTSDDAVYPAWFKFFAFHQITKLSQFDKERQAFKKRTPTTTAPFPDIDREALAQVCDLYVRANENAALTDEQRQINTRKFPAAYAHFIEQSLHAQQERSDTIKGEWRRFHKGNMQDARILYESLQGRGTGWCTAGESTARKQVESGDFHVFYSNDTNGNPTQPRLAIRMQGDDIGEVRGILPSQNVEPILQPVLDEKLAAFGAKAERFKKRSEDMRHLTEIEAAMNAGTFDTLAAETKQRHLRFLYELDHKIEGFGYQRDPRIAELRARRNTERDMPIVFGCEPRQIARSKKEIRPDTKAYVGPLFERTLFAKTGLNINLLPPSIEHIYTRFPEEPVLLKTITIGGRTREELRVALSASVYSVDAHASALMGTIELSPAQAQHQLVILSAPQLGFASGAHFRDICAAARKLGLDPAPAEVGAQLLLQPFRAPTRYGWLFIGMKPIRDKDKPWGKSFVFGILRRCNGLATFTANSGVSGDSSFVFVRRPTARRSQVAR